MTDQRRTSTTGAHWFLVIALIVSGATWADSPPALGGYSPVSYFTEGHPQMGSAEFAVTYQNSTYYLTSAAQVETFNIQPDKYRPRYKSCAYSLTMGKKLPLDPMNFQIIGGYLLLFHKTEESDGLLQWKASGLSDEELIRRADKKYVFSRF